MVAQPEGLGGDAAFHRGLIQRGDDVLTEQIAQPLDFAAEGRVLSKRLHQRGDRHGKLLTGPERTGSLRQQFQIELLLLAAQAACLGGFNLLRRRGGGGCRRGSRPAPRSGFFRRFRG